MTVEGITLRTDNLTKEQKLAILRDTVEYYGADPRNRRAVLRNGGCAYIMSGGRRCAAGRYLDPSDEEKVRTYWNVGDGIGILTQEGICSPQEERFWMNLQSIHDLQIHWNPYGGLTPAGEDAVIVLEQRIEAGEI